MSFAKQLKDMVEGMKLSDRDRLEASKLAADHADLVARRIAGEDPEAIDAELRIVQATAANLVAENGISVASQLRDGVARILAGALAAVLA